MGHPQGSARRSFQSKENSSSGYETSIRLRNKQIFPYGMDIQDVVSESDDKAAHLDDVLDSDHLVPASSSPAESSPIAATPPDHDLISCIQSCNLTQRVCPGGLTSDDSGLGDNAASSLLRDSSYSPSVSCSPVASLLSPFSQSLHKELRRVQQKRKQFGHSRIFNQRRSESTALAATTEDGHSLVSGLGVYSQDSEDFSSACSEQTSSSSAPSLATPALSNAISYALVPESGLDSVTTSRASSDDPVVPRILLSSNQKSSQPSSNPADNDPTIKQDIDVPSAMPSAAYIQPTSAKIAPSRTTSALGTVLIGSTTSGDHGRRFGHPQSRNRVDTYGVSLKRRRSNGEESENASAVASTSRFSAYTHLTGTLELDRKKRKTARAELNRGTRFTPRKHAAPALTGAFARMYAIEPASLRRAASLRSDTSVTAGQDNVWNEACPRMTCSASQSSSATCGVTSEPYAYEPEIPTEPVTPVSHSPRRLALAIYTDPPPSPVPIIAPPPFFLVPRAPLSLEDAAERRIVVLLEKERREREVDGLPYARAPIPKGPMNLTMQKKRQEDEEEEYWMDSDSEADGFDVNEMVDVWARGKYERDEDTTSYDGTGIALGIEDNLRSEAVDWLLNVLPPRSRAQSRAVGDLSDLLRTSEETHFHAAYLFIRYSLHIGLSPASSPAPSKVDEVSAFVQDGEVETTWDLAVACLTLSVKFHRDVLFPLDVILSNEFLALAPHSMSFEDLEVAQRDILEALSYRVGSATPGSFMEELWFALTSLRKLLDFDEGWKTAQKEAWAILTNALLSESNERPKARCDVVNDLTTEPDVLRFPISLLTMCALLDGITESLVHKYKHSAHKKDGQGSSKCIASS
ncbi:hypothetical protein A0H81_13268 [Grifola frondosa]|uniref:Uncharacterized protein n=1 Tax=Grifola frondosa TaxID=5627 RepID=A0A1C7LRY8_GRIFR|nr:hypothetical protein A0H81_13268 [Grifola frondosa]